VGEGVSLRGQGFSDGWCVSVGDPLQQVVVAPQQRPHLSAANAFLRAVLAVVVQLKNPVNSQSTD